MDHYASSPYNYGLNNPILMIDPDGMEADTGKTRQLVEVNIFAYKNQPKLPAKTGFWNYVDYYLNGRTVGNYRYDSDGNPIGFRVIT